MVVSLAMVAVPTKMATATSSDLMTTAAGGTGPRSSAGVLKHLVRVIQLSPKMFVPAFVYYCMNRLSFVALRRIDAATFTVCAQLKTATTAIFSYLILGRRFSGPRIRALVHMVCSVVVISEFAATHGGASSTTDSSGDEEIDLGVFMTGLLAVLTEVVLSGAISVFYEKVLKDDIVQSGLSVWDRNIQLAMFSIILYSPTLVSDGWFANWTPLTFIIAFLGAAGGLMVAFSMKYADAILKALATSGAIVVTAFAGALWLDGPFGVPVLASSVSVILAILTYVTDGKIFNDCQEKGAK
jgi:UDP-sugar transporter A1/2/3